MDHKTVVLPPLDTLRFFEAAARAGSFSAASHALNVTHGAVSRQIAKLEHWVGRRLFDRHGRGVSLTPDGQRLFIRTIEAFALISDESDRWVEARGGAVVRVASMPSVSGLWLMPRLLQLEAGEPALRIELLVDNRQVDLEAETIDLALRCGRGGLPGRKSVQLFEEHCYPIGAPALAAALGSGAPERLISVPLIHDSDTLGWRTWFAAQGLDYRPKRQDRRFEDYNLVLDAAAHGLGVALARPPLVGEALASGRVVRVDHRTTLNPVAYWLDRPHGRMRAAAAELARRIMRAAEVPESAAEGFVAERGRPTLILRQARSAVSNAPEAD